MKMVAVNGLNSKEDNTFKKKAGCFSSCQLSLTHTLHNPLKTISKMGTRNLTMVIQNEETKVAQYGQWDGYPNGQGATIVKFLLANLGNNLEKFRQAVSKCSWLTDEENNEMTKAAYVMAQLRKAKDPANPTEAEVKSAEKYATEKMSGDMAGWMNMEESECYKITAPGLSRDFGAEILQFIQDKDGNTDFLEDGLFCEWAYKVNLDNNTLEVYCGGNNLLATFTFDQLQELGVGGFVDECNALASEDED
jgi:hypothetical protein